MPQSWIIMGLLVFGYSLAVIAVIHALLRARQPQSALGWVGAIIAMPFIGAFGYFIFGVNRVDSRAAKLMSNAAARRMEMLRIMSDGNQAPPTHYTPENCRIMNIGEGKASSFTRFGSNHITPLFNGDEAYPRMLNAIATAQHEVFLSTYLFYGKEYGRSFAKALLSAHRRGVDVRVLVDGMGTWAEWSKPWKRLLKHKVALHRFIPPRLIPPQLSINLRNHRKVLVCDGVGFTGGMNIADSHVMSCPGKDHVQDVHFLCEGPIAGELREAFLMDWAFVTGQDDTGRMPLPCGAGDMDARVVMDGPGTPQDPMLDLFCGVIGCASERVTILTPYFLPPRELSSALSSAVARGVDVRIILPGTLDHPYVGWAVTHMLPPLLENGVRVFYQPGPFAHTKLLMVDDLYTCFGSTNLDPRSLSLNFELNMEVFSPELNTRLTAHADAIIERSAEVTAHDLASISLGVKLRNAAVWIFSPYL